MFVYNFFPHVKTKVVIFCFGANKLVQRIIIINSNKSDVEGSYYNGMNATVFYRAAGNVHETVESARQRSIKNG